MSNSIKVGINGFGRMGRGSAEVARRAGSFRAVGRAQVWRATIKDNERTGRGLDGHRLFLGPWRVIVCFGHEPAVCAAIIALLQRQLVGAGNKLHAAVLERRVLQGEPEADAGLGLRVDVGRVLVADDFAANPRRLEDIHGLQDRRGAEAHASGDAGQ